MKTHPVFISGINSLDEQPDDAPDESACVCGHTWRLHDQRGSTAPGDVSWFPCAACQCATFTAAPDELAQANTRRPPTIAELEAILQQKNVQIEIRPNGEVFVRNEQAERIAELEAQLLGENRLREEENDAHCAELEELEAQLAEANARADGILKAYEDVRHSNDSLRDTTKRLRAALEAVEWVRNAYQDMVCPWCDADHYQDGDHRDNCTRQAALNPREEVGK